MEKVKSSTFFRIILDYVILTICLLVSAVNFNLFMKPIDFVTGGTPGLALIIEHVFDIPSNYFIYGVYVIMFILSLIILGKKSIIGILYATIFYPLFVTLTEDIISFIIIDYNDFFMISVISGVISGISNGFVYKLGFPSSGLGIIGPIFNKCFHLPIASTNFVMNTIIVSIGGYFFGIDMVLYAIVFLYLNSFISNRIILGISNNKALFIRSSKLNEINKYLYETYSIESILIDAYGGYTNEKGYLALIIIPSLKYNLIINEIKKIDNKVFYDVLDSYEVQGSSNYKLISN